MKNLLSLLKTGVPKFKINFKTKLKEYRNKLSLQRKSLIFKTKFKEYRKSQRRSFILGFTIVVGIFGLTLFGPALSAVAKELPKNNQRPTDIPTAPNSTLIPSILYPCRPGLGNPFCEIVIASFPFAVGTACGCLVILLILHFKMQKKQL